MKKNECFQQDPVVSRLNDLDFLGALFFFQKISKQFIDDGCDILLIGVSHGIESQIITRLNHQKLFRRLNNFLFLENIFYLCRSYNQIIRSNNRKFFPHLSLMQERYGRDLFPLLKTFEVYGLDTHVNHPHMLLDLFLHEMKKRKLRKAEFAFRNFLINKCKKFNSERGIDMFLEKNIEQRNRLWIEIIKKHAEFNLSDPQKRSNSLICLICGAAHVDIRPQNLVGKNNMLIDAKNTLVTLFSEEFSQAKIGYVNIIEKENTIFIVESCRFYGQPKTSQNMSMCSTRRMYYVPPGFRNPDDD